MWFILGGSKARVVALGLLGGGVGVAKGAAEGGKLFCEEGEGLIAVALLEKEAGEVEEGV